MERIERRIGRGADGAVAARVWRELGQLALEGVAIGLAFSILLAAAVYMVARSGHDEPYYTTQQSPALLAATVA